MNRILLYVHYNPNGSLSEYVKYQLEQLREHYSKIVLISNSVLSENQLSKLSENFDTFIQRKNVGFDFSAWRDGLYEIGWDKLNDFDSVTLMNDTCFGPVFDFSIVLEKMEVPNIDFWGITNHDETKNGMPGTNQPIPAHLQSYFVCFNKNVVVSKTFRNFWENIKNFTDVTDVIQNYETKFSEILIEAGFSNGVYFDSIKYKNETGLEQISNFSEFRPLVLLDNDVPFIKIKSFVHTSFQEIIDKISRKSFYPTNMIVEHLTSVGIIKNSGQPSRMLVKIRHLGQLWLKSERLVSITKKIPGFNSFYDYLVKNYADHSADRVNIIPDHGEDEDYMRILAKNYLEHDRLIQNENDYYFEKESNKVYVRSFSDPKVIAVYLPQFHPFPENDKAWGKGFTEWTNVTASKPGFVGQRQPIFPSDLGFYDLRVPQILKDQIELAKKYGIFGFQFYYYWFSGKKVMDLPINTLLAHPEWNFNFSICWANENWTKKWDGTDKDIIFEQLDKDDDPEKFIQDIAPILNDPRYITEKGKPILTVYRLDLIKDPKRYANVWRTYFREHFGKELWLVACTNFENFKAENYGFDALMDFTPTNSLSPVIKPWVKPENIFINNQYTNKLLGNKWNGVVIDYREIAKLEMENIGKNINTYKTISPSWCNEARRKWNDGFTFHKSSPEIFAKWLDRILDYEINQNNVKSPIVYINAWNEWAEGAMIEPSSHLGHNSLKRIAEVVSRYSENPENAKKFPAFGFQVNKDAKLAVIVHLFYPEMWPIFENKLKNIRQTFDLYVTVSPEFSDLHISKISEYHSYSNVIVVANRGRDILPFLTLLERLKSFKNYQYFLKLHSKKSLHREDGNAWLNEILEDLLPEDNLEIIKTLEDPKTGLIGPASQIVSLSRHLGSNELWMKEVLSRITSRKKIDMVFDSLETYPYFGGTMFWGRFDSLGAITNLYLMPSDFESETGQIDGTIAHAIERILGRIVHELSGLKMYSNSAGQIIEIKSKIYDEEFKYARASEIEEK